MPRQPTNEAPSEQLAARLLAELVGAWYPSEMLWRSASLGLVLLAACKITPGDGGSGGGGGAGGAQGGAGGSEPTCAVTDCDECRQCAASGPCKPYFDACFDNPACDSMDVCMSSCGALPDECLETCRAQNPAGADDYEAARGCMDCNECDHACASDFPCGG